MWLEANGAIDPNVNKNETGKDIYSNEGASVYHPAKTYLNMHPGPQGQVTIVRWTCPKAGKYKIDSAFRSMRFGGPPTTTDVHVLRNNTAVFNAEINGHYDNGETPFVNTYKMEKGDIIDFAVGYGTDGDYGYDSTGLRAIITAFSNN